MASDTFPAPSTKPGLVSLTSLASLYGVETKRFNEAVRRNLAKFPADFMFTRSSEEFGALRSQFATSNDQAPAVRSISAQFEQAEPP